MPPHERGPAVEDVVDLLAIAGRHHPVADRNIDADVPDPGDTEFIGVVRRDEQRAPAAIEARDSGGRSGSANRVPGRVEVITPPQRDPIDLTHRIDGTERDDPAIDGIRTTAVDTCPMTQETSRQLFVNGA